MWCVPKSHHVGTVLIRGSISELRVLGLRKSRDTVYRHRRLFVSTRMCAGPKEFLSSCHNEAYMQSTMTNILHTKVSLLMDIGDCYMRHMFIRANDHEEIA